MAIITVMCINSCKCSNEEPTETVIETVELNVENLVSADREKMYLDYEDNYRWYETTITLNDYLDSDTDSAFVTDSTIHPIIECIANIFQALMCLDDSYDTQVVVFTHDMNNNTVEVEHGFWIEDFPLNNEEITLTFTEAMEKIMETNYPKPHSKYVVLRKQVGPIPANPQYIFGNAKYQLYVDAVTGNVSDSNPAFNIKGFKMPLGEWP